MELTMTTLEANGPIQATHELPQWICQICQLKRPARVEDLLQRVAKLSLSQPRTIESYILHELDRRTRSGKLRYMRCLPNVNFTVSLNSLKGLDLPTRVKNRLGGLIEERGRNLKLRELKFHDLMGTPGMGAKSTLVFLNYFDGLGAPASAFKRVGPEGEGDVEEDPVQQKEALSNLVIEWKSMPWTEQVVIGDARFPDFRALCALLQAEFGDSLDQALRFWQESAWYLSPGDSVAIEGGADRDAEQGAETGGHEARRGAEGIRERALQEGEHTVPRGDVCQVRPARRRPIGPEGNGPVDRQDRGGGAPDRGQADKPDGGNAPQDHHARAGRGAKPAQRHGRRQR